MFPLPSALCSPPHPSLLMPVVGMQCWPSQRELTFVLVSDYIELLKEALTSLCVDSGSLF